MKETTALKRFEMHLKRQGLRVTQQRREILLLAWSTHEHFTAEELYTWAVAKDASISRATVYRTLSLLVDGGFLAPLDGGRGQMLYEHIMGHHHHDHMICLECNRIIEFRCDEIEELQEREALKRNFRIVSHSLTMEGYCSNCVRSNPALLEAEASE